MPTRVMESASRVSGVISMPRAMRVAMAAISASTGIARRLKVLDESRNPKPPLQMSAPVATAAITLSPFS